MAELIKLAKLAGVMHEAEIMLTPSGTHDDCID